MITANDFFKAWCSVTKSREADLINHWRDFHPKYPYLIKGSDDSIVKMVADKLDLKVYDSDYYSIDSVFYIEDDRIEKDLTTGFFLRGLSIAFKHENEEPLSLRQEASHLLILNCELRVLVFYNDDGNQSGPEPELLALHELIRNSRSSEVISAEGSFLIIYGTRLYQNLVWKGYIYRLKDWEQFF
ncbi:hypothetical protein Oweho_3413 [Owenweeksia hongkongensis DSM 17368]|uniref:Uncharacterized protein n=1 Tax=Owenweeksia hongkongensis (strain DSM 17368 / CIP 108786 / JCM 12287 / NRRL B-23963 / UST20020801) TaxID=926562 RepID=G8R5P6_OWEHD|nr:hypothetical protein [Owenweeksia hongkongensis]AEV34362.1 hypothetical protein Oweho_3413 [Owenweeksia hongkongensis DSM 17368]